MLHGGPCLLHIANSSNKSVRKVPCFPFNRYDVWMPNLAPSEALLKSAQKGLVSWGEFSRRYREELREIGEVDKRNRIIKNHGQKFTLRLSQRLGRSQNVTLMCHCDEDQQQCHRQLLKKVLTRKI